MLLGEVRQDRPRIEEDTVAADRPDDRDTGLEQRVAEVLHLTDASMDVIVRRHHLLDAPRNASMSRPDMPP